MKSFSPDVLRVDSEVLTAQMRRQERNRLTLVLHGLAALGWNLRWWYASLWFFAGKDPSGGPP